MKRKVTEKYHRLLTGKLGTEKLICCRCGKTIIIGDDIQIRRQGRNYRTKIYHEKCWSETFLDV